MHLQPPFTIPTSMTFCFVLAFTTLTAQQEETNYEKKYQDRIKQEYLNEVYIPADLGECFEQLNKLISPESKAKFKNMSEADAATRLHFSLGRWIWHNWSFYEGSRLSVYLNKMGVHHPEDMSQLIIITYHRYLNKQPLEVKVTAEKLAERREKEKKKQKAPR